jgi:hypothetical protein
MKALEILVNGELVCCAGVDGNGFVSANVIWDNRKAGVLKLIMQALGEDGRSWEWPAPSIALGDEITIRAADAATADPSPIEIVDESE